MNWNELKYLFVVLLLGVVVLSSCGNPQEEQSPTTTPDTSEVYIFNDFGFSINYPSGWITETRGTATAISQFEEDHRRFVDEDNPVPVKGYVITFDHRRMAFMRSLGLPSANPSLDDLFNLNAEFFELEEPIEVAEVTIFGVPSLKTKVRIDQAVAIFYQGFRNEGVFLLTVNAPTEEALNEFMPDWNAIVASIKPVSE